MIILRSEKGEVYNLFYRRKHIVGRNGSLELEGDKSVSRQHAAIHITLEDGKPKISLQDLGSKYGTFVNDGITSSKEIAKNTPTYLQIGDRVRFGQQWNIWTIEESQFVVCTSTLSQNEKMKLKSILTPLNGILVSDWTDGCSHLTMNNVMITVKVVYALASVKPIVSLEYWETLRDIMNSTREEAIPDCDDYIPPLKEPSLMSIPVSFKLNSNRKHLFNDVKFVAMTSSQYNSVLPMASKAGGTVLDGSQVKITEDQFMNEKIVVLQNENINKRNKNLAETLKILERNNWRLIPESEIGLSLIFCSIEKYCNPSFDATFIIRQAESQVTIKDEVSILTLETQDLGEENCTQFFDNDSSKFSLSVNEKRIFSESDEEPEPTSKVDQSRSTKRKRDDSNQPSTSKSFKLDNWLISKKTIPSTASPTTSIVSKTDRVSGTSSETTKIKNSLFSFPNEKPTNKNSSSLFSNLTNIEKSSTDNTKRKRSSMELFASIESSVVPAKKAKTGEKSFFDLCNKKNKTSIELFDSDDECVDSFSEKTAKLKIDSKPEFKSISVEIPQNISLSQFVETPVKLENGAVKQEPAENLPCNVRDMLDKTLVLTLPLVKRQSTNTSVTESSRSTGVNFKRFRKNNPYQRSNALIISTNDLFPYKEEEYSQELITNNLL